MLSVNNSRNFEGFVLVFLMANTKGTPCIGPKNSGAQEAISNGKTGYIVDPFNYKEAAEKIDTILNNKTINAQDCINWAMKNDIKIKVNELINFYRETCKNG